jgi:hypothetical protein
MWASCFIGHLFQGVVSLHERLRVFSGVQIWKSEHDLVAHKIVGYSPCFGGNFCVSCKSP